MKPERWKQIEQLYNAALQRDASHRAAFLEQACGEDEELHREVESLLAYDERAARFIETPPDDVAAAVLAAEQKQSMVGHTLGHYRIVSLLGAGGMGEVYLAEDTRLERKIALTLPASRQLKTHGYPSLVLMTVCTLVILRVLCLTSKLQFLFRSLFLIVLKNSRAI